MNVQLFLADYVSVAEGKLNALGIGWTFTGPGPLNFGVAGLVSVPWDKTNKLYDFVLGLFDEDGRPVSGPNGQPIRVEAQFEAGRPPGHTPGCPITAVLPPLNVVGLELPPASRFEWVAGIDGEEWRVGFNTRPAPAPVLS